MNAREIIGNSIKFFFLLSRRRVHESEFFPAVEQRMCIAPQQQHIDKRRRFSCSRSSERCVFLSFPSRSCVKVAMYVFFVVFAPCWTTDFFHYNRLPLEETLFFAVRENRGTEKEFCENCWKRHFSIDGFLLSCRRVVYFYPAEFGFSHLKN